MKDSRQFPENISIELNILPKEIVIFRNFVNTFVTDDPFAQNNSP